MSLRVMGDRLSAIVLTSGIVLVGTVIVKDLFPWFGVRDVSLDMDGDPLSILFCSGCSLSVNDILPIRLEVMDGFFVFAVSGVGVLLVCFVSENCFIVVVFCKIRLLLNRLLPKSTSYPVASGVRM